MYGNIYTTDFRLFSVASTKSQTSHLWALLHFKQWEITRPSKWRSRLASTLQPVLCNGTDLKFISQWHSLWQGLGLLATQVGNISLPYVTVTAGSHKSPAVCETNRCCDLAASHWGLLSSISLWKLPSNQSPIVCCISHGKWLLLSAS